MVILLERGANLALLKKAKKEEKMAGNAEQKDVASAEEVSEERSSSDDSQKSEISDVPDELPSLSQDVLNEAIPDEAAASEEDIPDELPTLDINGEIIAEPVEEPIAEVSEEVAPAESFLEIADEEVPDELEPLDIELGPAPAKEPKLSNAPEQPQPAPAQQSKPLSEEGYFADIGDKLKHGESPQNILSGMKEHWKKEPKSEDEMKTTTQRELEGEIRDLTLELQELESRWVENSHNMERTKNFILGIETEISIKSEELKNLLEKLDKVEKIYEKVKQNPN